MTLNRLIRHRALGLLLMLGCWSVAQAQDRYQLSADGQEVVDIQAHLAWKRCAAGMEWNGKVCGGKAKKFSFEAAKKYAAVQPPVAEQAWRLPTKDELLTLVDKSKKKKPLIDVKTFPGTPSALFWAVRPEMSDNLNAWIVNFSNGRVYGNNGSKAPLLRLVRSAG